MNWESKGNNIFGAFSTLTIRNNGRMQSFEIAFRIDGRGDSYRVDKITFPGMLWEAIDGGQGFSNKTKAKNFVNKWMGAAVEQNTLTPKVVDKDEMK
jgi:hypothetical protein